MYCRSTIKGHSTTMYRVSHVKTCLDRSFWQIYQKLMFSAVGEFMSRTRYSPSAFETRLLLINFWESLCQEIEICGSYVTSLEMCTFLKVDPNILGGFSPRLKSNFWDNLIHELQSCWNYWWRSWGPLKGRFGTWNWPCWGHLKS